VSRQAFRHSSAATRRDGGAVRARPGRARFAHGRWAQVERSRGPFPLAVAGELQACDDAAVNLVGAVGQPQRASGGPGAGERRSFDSPAPPCSCIAMSTTAWAMSCTATLIWETAPIISGACLSTNQAACSTCRRAWSIAIRASAMPRGCRRGSPAACRTRLARWRGDRRAPTPARPSRSAACSGGCVPGRAGLGDRERLAGSADDGTGGQAHVGEGHLARGLRVRRGTPSSEASRSTFTPGCPAVRAPSSAGGSGRHSGR